MRFFDKMLAGFVLLVNVATVILTMLAVSTTSYLQAAMYLLLAIWIWRSTSYAYSWRSRWSGASLEAGKDSANG